MGYIKRRRKRKSKTLHKNYTAFWTGVDGERKRKSTYTDDPSAARARLREYERDDSVWRPPGFTVAQACTLAGQVQLEKEDSEGWRRRCARVVTQHIYPIMGKDTDLNTVNIPELVDRYIKTRLGHKAPSGQPIKRATIRKELLLVRQGCDKGQLYERFFGNLRQFVPKRLSGKAAEKIGTALTVEQSNKLIEVATTHRRTWLLMGMHHGIDPKALHNIRPSDVHPQEGAHGKVYVPDTKNEHRPRKVPLTPETRWAIDYRLAHMKPGQEFVFSPKWTTQQITPCMKRWCAKVGIPRIRFKDLRHTCATFGGENGQNELVLGQYFGWSGKSEMLRKVYMHVGDEALDAVSAAMPRLRVPDMRQASPDPDRKSQHISGNAEAEQIENPLEKAG
jgi:integrase